MLYGKIKKIKDNNINKLDKLIWVLTVLLFSSFYIYSTNAKGSMILFVITVVVLFLSVVSSAGRIEIYFGAFHGFIVTFGLFCLISSIWAINANDAIDKGITIFEILICLTVFYWYYRKQDGVDSLLKSVMWGGYVVTFYTYLVTGVDNVISVLTIAGRLSSTFDNINSIGMLAAITVIIALYYLMYEGFSLCFMFTVPAIILIIASGSRKALVILVFGVLLLLSLKIISKQKVFGIIKICIFLFITYFIVLGLSSLKVFTGIGLRMQGLLAAITGQGTIDHSAWLRQQYIKIGLQIFKNHPFLGIGMGNVHILNSINDTYLHNNYIELLANGGIIGFTLYYSIFIFFFKRIFAAKDSTDNKAKIVITLMLCLLISDYGMVSYYSKNTLFYFLLFFLYTLKLPRKKRSIVFAKNDIRKYN
jgi:O-antigen ligase